MGERMELIESKRLEILDIVHRHRGRSVSVFGSEDLLGTPVDVVSVGGLKKRDRHIRSEALPL